MSRTFESQLLKHSFAVAYCLVIEINEACRLPEWACPVLNEPVYCHEVVTEEEDDQNSDEDAAEDFHIIVVEPIEECDPGPDEVGGYNFTLEKSGGHY